MLNFDDFPNLKKFSALEFMNSLIFCCHIPKIRSFFVTQECKLAHFFAKSRKIKDFQLFWLNKRPPLCIIYTAHQLNLQYDPTADRQPDAFRVVLL